MKRTLRTLKAVLRDPRCPRSAKILGAIAILPIPGPVDEIAGAAAVAILTRRAPGLWREHWNAVTDPPISDVVERVNAYAANGAA